MHFLSVRGEMKSTSWAHDHSDRAHTHIHTFTHTKRKTHTHIISVCVQIRCLQNHIMLMSC